METRGAVGECEGFFWGLDRCFLRRENAAVAKAKKAEEIEARMVAQQEAKAQKEE